MSDIAGTIVVSPSLSGTIGTTAITGGISLSPALAGTVASSTLSGSIVLPLSISGVVLNIFGVGSIVLPSFTLLASGDVGSFGLAYVSIPFIAVAASGYTSVVGGEANISLPALTLSADGGYASVIGEAALSLPRLALSGTALVTIVGQGAIVLPKLQGYAEAHQSVIGTLSVSLPAMDVSATALAGSVGSFGQSLPSLQVFGSSVPYISGTANISIPALLLYAVSSPVAASYLSMVMNIKNRALTLFTNYAFNSLCHFNGLSFGATSTAIYDLTGDTDAGTLIDWNFRTGYLDLEQKEKKRLVSAWLSYKTDGDLIMTVIQPNGESYEYRLEGIYLTETGLRAKVGKGIRSKYVALDVKNDDGSTISLDVLKINLEKMMGKPR